ncbi:MAG: YlxR family protein [Oscillospiraceae bacterium]|nr:YlxR family protein [Oscillospiraceae bacterium]
MPKTIPIRQCIGCRTQKPKTELIRVVRSPEGNVSLDFRGKVSGRGAYLCRDAACLKKAQKSRALERSLAVPIPQEVYERLLSEMEGADG